MVNLNFIPTLNFETFKEMLSRKETLIQASEAQEFFEDFAVQIEENTKLLEKFTEEEILEKLTSILVFIPADALMGLHLPKIVTLLLCDEDVLEDWCYRLSHGTVKTHDICCDKTDDYCCDEADDYCCDETYDYYCIFLDELEEAGLIVLDGYSIKIPVLDEE